MPKSLVLRTVPKNWNIVLGHLLAQVELDSIFYIIDVSLYKSGFRNKLGLSSHKLVRWLIWLVCVIYVWSDCSFSTLLPYIVTAIKSF